MLRSAFLASVLYCTLLFSVTAAVQREKSCGPGWSERRCDHRVRGEIHLWTALLFALLLLLWAVLRARGWLGRLVRKTIGGAPQHTPLSSISVDMPLSPMKEPGAAPAPTLLSAPTLLGHRRQPTPDSVVELLLLHEDSERCTQRDEADERERASLELGNELHADFGEIIDAPLSPHTPPPPPPPRPQPPEQPLPPPQQQPQPLPQASSPPPQQPPPPTQSSQPPPRRSPSPPPPGPHSILHAATRAFEAAMAAGGGSDQEDGAGSGEMDVELLVAAFRTNLAVTEVFGSMMTPAVKNDLANLDKLAKAWEALGKRRGAAQVATLRGLLEAERASGVHKPGGVLRDPSAGIALTWLRRSLAFQRGLLQGLAADRGATLSAVATAAYKAHLERYHNWVLRGTFKVCLGGLPARDVFLDKLGPELRPAERAEVCYREAAEVGEAMRRADERMGALLVALDMDDQR
ncbi:hypothetical protein EMIHUDRAFT_357682, partial [Emiliania huxleyi CCMP1516]